MPRPGSGIAWPSCKPDVDGMSVPQTRFEPRAGATRSPVVYRIDAADLIVSVNAAFDEFARANGAEGLSEEVVGRSIFDFIAGSEVSMLWRMLLARARAGVALTIPYRCDADDVRRELTMDLVRGADGSIDFVSTTVSVSARPPLALFAPEHRSERLLKACSWCCRFEVGAWVEAEEAVRRLGLLSEVAPRLTHGMCPECARRVRGELGAP
jgi:hypothetical protein